MNKIEEVKNIIEMAKASGAWQGDIPFEDFWADRICRLFEPKPDGSKLLIDGEIKKIMESCIYYHAEQFGSSGAIQVMDFDIGTATDQICQLFDTECQARVEGIFEDIEQHKPESPFYASESDWGSDMTIFKLHGWYQALKKREGIK